MEYSRKFMFPIDNTSVRTKNKYAHMILKLITEQMNMVSMIDIDDFALFDDMYPIRQDFVVKTLLEQFQRNPLFTPAFASLFHKDEENPLDLGVICTVVNSNGEIIPVKLILHPESLVNNSSWDLYDIMTMIPEDDIERFLRLNARAHHQYHEVALHYDLSDDDISESILDSAQYDICICIEKYSTFIRNLGGVVKNMKEYRVIETLMCNPNVSFSILLNIWIGAGYDSFWENPFAIGDIAIPDLYTKKPECLEEILTEIFIRCDFDVIMRDVDKINKTLTCLIAMVSFNSNWDHTMDSKFGKKVWDVIKKGWDILWIHHSPAMNIGITTDCMEHNEKYFKIMKMITELWNPSWFTPSPKKLVVAFETETRTIIEVMLGDCITIWDVNAYDSYVKCVLNKDMVRRIDIIDILKENPSLYYRQLCVEKAYFRGESAMVIGKFFFNKMIVPMRRARAYRIAKNVLSRVSEDCGKDVSKTNVVIRNIASFMTS